MSDQVQKIGFGYQDDTDEKLKSKSGGVFGLNQGFVTKFEFNPNAGKDGTAGNAIDITVQIGEREFRSRLYEPTRIFDNDGNEIVDQTSKEYIEGYNTDWVQKAAVITHVLKCFRTEQEVKQAFSAPIADFANYAAVAAALLPDGFHVKPLDIFLEYQWQPSKGQDRTFLQLPKNMKGGYFMMPVQPGVFKEEITPEGQLIYKNEAGQEHPFSRDKNFMEGPKANQQIEGEETEAPVGSAPAAEAARSTWGAQPSTTT